MKGDWWLPLMFSVIPAVGLAYALTLAKHRAEFPFPTGSVGPNTPLRAVKQSLMRCVIVDTGTLSRYNTALRVPT